ESGRRIRGYQSVTEMCHLRSQAKSPKDYPLTSARVCSIVCAVVDGECRPRREVQTGGCFAMLNDRAREILSFIQLYSREKGYPPTIREIGHAFHISSTNGVRYYLD